MSELLLFPYVEHSLEPTRTELEQNRNGTEKCAKKQWDDLCIFEKDTKKEEGTFTIFLWRAGGGALHHISGVNISIGKNIECFSQQNF